MRGLSWSRLAAAGLLVSLVPVASPLQAQVPIKSFRNGITYGVGYAGVLPDAPLGGGAFRLFGGRLGAFVDAKLTTGNLKKHEGYCPPALGNCNVASVESQRNDLRIRTANEWLIVNAGAVYTLSPTLALLLGGGAARKNSYVEFVDENEDPELRITTSGNYYVDNPDESGWKPQATVGFLFRAGSSLVLRVGYESAIKGGSVGVYLVP